MEPFLVIFSFFTFALGIVAMAIASWHAVDIVGTKEAATRNAAVAMTTRSGGLGLVALVLTLALWALLMQ